MVGREKEISMKQTILLLLIIGCSFSLFAQEKPEAAYVTSSEIVHELFTQAPPELAQNLKNLLYFTHHERIAAALRAAGAENIRLVARLDMHTLQRETE